MAGQTIDGRAIFSVVVQCGHHLPATERGRPCGRRIGRGHTGTRLVKNRVGALRRHEHGDGRNEGCVIVHPNGKVPCLAAKDIFSYRCLLGLNCNRGTQGHGDRE